MDEKCPYCNEEHSALKNHIRLSAGGGHGSNGEYPDDFDGGVNGGQQNTTETEDVEPTGDEPPKEEIDDAGGNPTIDDGPPEVDESGACPKCNGELMEVDEFSEQLEESYRDASREAKKKIQDTIEQINDSGGAEMLCQNLFRCGYYAG